MGRTLEMPPAATLNDTTPDASHPFEMPKSNEPPPALLEPCEAATASCVDHPPLARAIRDWHQGLSTSQLLDMQTTIGALEKRSPLHIGTAFSGTDIIVHLLKTFSECWAELFNSRVQFVSRYACDSDPEVQQFLMNHVLSRDCALFQDVEHLARASALNLMTNKVEIVPYADIFVAGITCTDRARASGNAGRMLNCVQTGQGKTGEAGQLVLRAISSLRPEVAILECVDGLAQKDTGKSKQTQSDAEYIVDELRRLGYGASTITTDAADHGSVARRRAFPLWDTTCLIFAHTTPCP